MHPQDVAPAYVYAAIRNHAATRGRKRGRREPARLEQPTQTDGAFEASSNLHQALDRLAREDADAAEVITLKHGCGLTLAQIARVTGRPLGTVAGQHRRGLGRLRNLLPDHADDPARTRETP